MTFRIHPRYPTGSAWALERFWGHVGQSATGCWEWGTSKNAGGYGIFRLTRSKKRRVVMNAHRMAYILTHGVWLNADQLVCHRCDNPGCVRPDHLFLGTNADNMRDCAEKGRHRNLKKPDCPRCGLPFSPASESLAAFGVKRVCWPCRKNADAIRARANRQAARIAAAYTEGR